MCCSASFCSSFSIFTVSISLTEISYMKIRKEEGQTLLRGTQISAGVLTQFGPNHHSVSIISYAECFPPI